MQNTQNQIDSDWQNPDGTLKKLSWAASRALSDSQKIERKNAQNREYSRRAWARYNSQKADAARARSMRLRARREQAAAIEAQRLARSYTHRAFPAPPGASIDVEIRHRIACMNLTGKRPACGVF